MHEQNLQKVLSKYNPFLEYILNNYKDKIDSVHIVGSVITDDFDLKTSKINSIFVLKSMDLKFLEILAPLGKKFGKKQITAPLIMTGEYVEKSLDVFPLEFLNIKLYHKTIFGNDIFKDIEINISDLRHQCERELKVKLAVLRQSYISASGDVKLLAEQFVNSIDDFIALFRGIIVLHGDNPPESSKDVLISLEKSTGIDKAVFMSILMAKNTKVKFTAKNLDRIFEEYYKSIERLGDITDEISV